MDEGAQWFGALLRTSRRSSGLSQEQLASRAGMSIRAISKLESGRTRWPYPDSVVRLADALCLLDAERAAFVAAAERRVKAEPAPGLPRAGFTDIPRLLPALAPVFTGRGDELRILSRMLGDSAGDPVVTAITGSAGSGKTALAANWAYKSAANFPDGHLFVNLHGFGPADAPLTVPEAVRVFLDALRVPADRVPETTEARLGLYRSLLAGKRMLVILDNARDTAQVRPLLPGMPSCRVIITSRYQLPGLTAIEAARPLAMTPLTPAEARQLLATRLGAARLAAERNAVEQIISSCEGLPLALCIIAARAGLRPGLPLARLAADLAGQRPLDAFCDMADPVADIRASFSWSYQRLDDDEARAFRLAGLNSAADLEPHAVAALTGTTPEQAARVLEALARACMLRPAGLDRYTMNSLLRAYAREQAILHEDGKEGRPALTA